MMLWYTARGAGLSALVLLTIATSLGALVSRRGSPAPASRRSAERRYVLQYLHRVCAALGLTVLAVHITTILADSYAGVGWRGALVPFTSGYRPAWVALGSLAAYTFVGVAVLGAARGRMAASPRGARVWRALHCLAYAGWLSAMWHGFLSGSDSDVGWVRLVYLACLGAVLASVGVRLAALRTEREDARRRVSAPSRPATLPISHPVALEEATR